MTPLILIPARIGSARLPAKALACIGGKPLIAHVLERALEASVGRVAVATDSGEIAAAARAAGGEAVMTRGDHACGSDRVFEAASVLDPEGRYGVVVNLQGDQPFLPTGALAAALALLEDETVHIGTLAAPMAAEEADDPNAVKLVGSRIGPRRLRALYFTRARAPHGEGPLYHHLGVYAFRRAALARFAAQPVSELERRERLEQLRALEDGMRIDAAELDNAGVSVDTPRDLDAARDAAARERQ
ncbi:MAG TPA: 3-deoxy-manno-octulosonate cytidylyltransferase [Methylocystis sp.]|nr:3-deoxy-manno-octulosonate cytidylyltransferase [Methylocystis sp.]